MSDHECEAKFIGLPYKKMHHVVLTLLNKEGFKIVHHYQKLIRTAYHLANSNNKGYCRVRKGPDGTFITAKIFNFDAKFPLEFEIKVHEDGVDSEETFHTANKLMRGIGLQPKASHVTYRLKLINPNDPTVNEIVVDIVPGLPPYIEIDCTTEESLEKYIQLLDLPRENMRYGAYDKTYQEFYGIPLDEINDRTPFLTFDNIINEIKPRKNAQNLKEIYCQYQNCTSQYWTCGFDMKWE